MDPAILYPHPGVWPVWTLLLSGSILACITLLAVGTWRSHPYFIVGWLWFPGSLTPVIGLTQVGKQAYAERFAYWPYLGLYIAVVWGGADLVRHLRLWWRWVAPPIAGAVMVMFAMS